MTVRLLIFLFTFSFLLITGPARAADPSGCIDINTAPKEELIKIKQIGEARAEQIMNLREEKLFSSVDDMDRIIGIGPARITDIKEQGLACVSEVAEARPPLLLPKVNPINLTESSSTLTRSNDSEPTTIGGNKPLEDYGPSILLPVAIFTSFSGGVMILLLKKKLHVGP
ncbi:MAG: helix-hairpin-helix domain-containing protein [bacterium]|nr:helix-hairpin-helix domain-containing protein [bacterium]